jgi:hypothetical protein
VHRFGWCPYSVMGEAQFRCRHGADVMFSKGCVLNVALAKHHVVKEEVKTAAPRTTGGTQCGAFCMTPAHASYVCRYM